MAQRVACLLATAATVAAFAPSAPAGRVAWQRQHSFAPPAATVEDQDKVEVKDYFNNEGFDRWNRIYSEDGEVNTVQLDIRTGHEQTIDKVLKWVDADGDAAGKKFCDAGCGVGSLAIPLAARGAKVFASDISAAMVSEATRRAKGELGGGARNTNFKTADLESLSGKYDTVTCIDVMIHYPSDRMQDMVAKLGSLSSRRLIISFAPKTLFYQALKTFGSFFPGPSKTTRAYLHTEEDVRKALKDAGFTVKRTDTTATNFYISWLFEAVRE